MTETVERLKAVRFQVDSMICQSDEAHCVYPDPNPVVNELDEIIALLATPPRITEEAVKWTRLGDQLPDQLQHVLLADQREGENFWRVRSAVMHIRHEGVVPKLSDMDGGRLPANWWFDAVYGSDIRLAKPDMLWAPLPTPAALPLMGGDRG